MKRFTLHSIFFACCLTLIGQDKKLDPNTLRVESLDFNNQILDGKNAYDFMFNQDHEGYFWIGTSAGAFLDNRKTCIHLSDFLIQKGVPLPTTTYRDVFRDKNNRIWMGTERGLFVYHLSTQKLTQINPPFPSSGDRRLVDRVFGLVRNNGIVYATTFQGFYMVDMETLEVIDQYLHEQTYIVPQNGMNKVEAVYPDAADEIIWGSCFNGMFRVDRSRKSVEIFRITEEEDVTGRIIPARYFFYTGAIYGKKIFFPTYENAVMSFDTVSKAYEVHLIDEKKVPPFKAISRNQIKGFIPYNKTEAIVQSWPYGLGVFNIESKEYEFVQPQEYYIGQGPIVDRHGHLRLEDKVTRVPVFPKSDDISYHLHVFEMSNRDSALIYPGMFSHTKMSVYYENDPLSLTFGVVDYPKDKDIEYQYALKRNRGKTGWEGIGQTNKLTLHTLPSNTKEIELRALHKNEVVASNSIPITVIRPFTAKPIFFVLLSTVITILVSALTYSFINRKRKREVKELQVQRIINDLESKALRSQMNPHFIFNALNSIKSLIQDKQDDSAIDYLTKFSLFVRQVLSYSEEKLITLEQEVEMCRLYLEMEQLRFSKSLEYQITIDPAVDLSFIKVPPMILQPFLENAIWHGLMHKDGDRKLELNIKGNGDIIECIVDDNGIGRKLSAKIKNEASTKYQSFGTRITRERLEKYQELTQNQVHLDISDKMNGTNSTGTQVVIRFEV